MGEDTFTISIPLPIGPDNLIGRECPNEQCLKYFRIQPGTGLKGENLPCHCPYCGHTGPQNTFHTPEQINHTKAAGKAILQNALNEFVKNVFSKNQSTSGRNSLEAISIRKAEAYRSLIFYEEKLETVVICENCTLRYSVFGLFAFCPDCGIHNSITILKENLQRVEAMLELAGNPNSDLTEELIGNALGHCVATFDGYGREICKLKGKEFGFQNLWKASERVATEWGFHLNQSVSEPDWKFALLMFQKRHLFAHKLGVIDQEYIEKTSQPASLLGRKVKVEPEEVKALKRVITDLAVALAAGLGINSSTPEISSADRDSHHQVVESALGALPEAEKEILMAIESDAYKNLIELRESQLGSFLGNNKRKFIDMSDPNLSANRYMEAAESLRRKGFLTLSHNRTGAKVYELTVAGIEKARGLITASERSSGASLE